MADGEVGPGRTPERRIERAQETRAAIDLVLRDTTPENIAAFHDLHARHLREDGDEDGVKRAEVRAAKARKLSRGAVTL